MIIGFATATPSPLLSSPAFFSTPSPSLSVTSAHSLPYVIPFPSATSDIVLPLISAFHSSRQIIDSPQPFASSCPTPAPPHSAAIALGGSSTKLEVAKAYLVGSGALLSFFVWNTFTAISFIRRSRAKNNILFYLLLGSQLPGVVGVTAAIIAEFVQTVDCTLIGILTAICIQVAHALMFTGIMGIKAYRCLGNSPLVVVVLVCIRGAMLVLLGIEIPHIHSSRSDALGTCAGGWFDSSLLRYIMLLQFAEALFLCGCFLFAVWKSTRTTVDQRLSIRISADATEDLGRDAHHTNRSTNSARGWWDYVPDAQLGLSPAEAEQTRSIWKTLVRGVSAVSRRLFHRHEIPPPSAFHRKSSLPGEYPIPQPRRCQNAGPNAMSAQPRRDDLRRPEQSHPAQARPTLAAIDRFLKNLPRGELLLQMLRNELLYTTLLAAAFLGIAIMLTVGVTADAVAGVDVWITVDWVLISALTMHSFSRVIRRHEYDAAIQHPSAWTSPYLEASSASRRNHARSPVGVTQFRPRRRDVLSVSTPASIRTSFDRSSETFDLPTFVDPLRLDPLFGTQSSHDLSISPSTLCGLSPSDIDKSYVWSSPPTMPVSSDLGDRPSPGDGPFRINSPFLEPRTVVLQPEFTDTDDSRPAPREPGSDSKLPDYNC
ncbi:hypothetical protein BKA93DRAFT_411100 [Sparassis latifolia]